MPISTVPQHKGMANDDFPEGGSAPVIAGFAAKSVDGPDACHVLYHSRNGSKTQKKYRENPWSNLGSGGGHEVGAQVGFGAFQAELAANITADVFIFVVDVPFRMPSDVSDQGRQVASE
jgi:hypothetical protein